MIEIYLANSELKVIPQKPTDRIHKMMAIKGQCPRTHPPPKKKTPAGSFQTYINEHVTVNSITLYRY